MYTDSLDIEKINNNLFNLQEKEIKKLENKLNKIESIINCEYNKEIMVQKILEVIYGK